MSVVIETTLGDITVDLFITERPLASLNFLKLCKVKYYNFNLFHTIERGFIAQTGDPTGSGDGGSSIYGEIDGPGFKFFPAERLPKIKHTTHGLLSFVGNSEGMIASQFFITLGDDLTYLDDNHCVFGEVMEGLDVLEMLNETICDSNNRPYKDIRITHTVILEDPFDDMVGLAIPDRSPSPSAERLRGGRIAPDEEIDDTKGKGSNEINEMLADREAKARATILEMVGDLPEADMAPPENVLFVCKLNPVTTDDDLEIIFGRFGKIVSCEVIRDKKNGESLQYAFVEFSNPKSCEDAYFKMDNVLIDDRRIHVDFSQSVSRIKWMGKGRYTTFDADGRKTNNNINDPGLGLYKQDRMKRPSSVQTQSIRHKKTCPDDSRSKQEDRSSRRRDSSGRSNKERSSGRRQEKKKERDSDHRQRRDSPNLQYEKKGQVYPNSSKQNRNNTIYRRGYNESTNKVSKHYSDRQRWTADKSEVNSFNSQNRNKNSDYTRRQSSSNKSREKTSVQRSSKNHHSKSSRRRVSSDSS